MHSPLTFCFVSQILCFAAFFPAPFIQRNSPEIIFARNSSNGVCLLSNDNYFFVLRFNNNRGTKRNADVRISHKIYKISFYLIFFASFGLILYSFSPGNFLITRFFKYNSGKGGGIYFNYSAFCFVFVCMCVVTLEVTTNFTTTNGQPLRMALPLNDCAEFSVTFPIVLHRFVCVCVFFFIFCVNDS